MAASFGECADEDDNNHINHVLLRILLDALLLSCL